MLRATIGLIALSLFCIIPGGLLDSGYIMAGIGTGVILLAAMAWGSGAEYPESDWRDK